MKKRINIEYYIETYEDNTEFLDTLKAADMRAALLAIREEVFRPARKHGYMNATLQGLMNDTETSVELVGLLEDMYNDILDRYDVK
jgi:hypothetical protein